MSRYEYDDKRIISMLSNGNYTIKDISRHFDIPYQTMRNHIAKLKTNQQQKKKIKIPKGYRAIRDKEEFKRLFLQYRMEQKIKEEINNDK